MRYAIAVHGTRGDVEPAAAVGLELRRRGHDVRMAVPPNLVDFAGSAGLDPVSAYGPDSHQQLDADIFREWYKVRNPATVLREAREYISEGWQEMSATLTELAADADLILTGTTYQEVAGNVAEFHGIPLAALHYFPARPNTQILPVRLPMPMVRPVWSVAEWGHWRLIKPTEDEQRRALGLPAARYRAIRRMAERGALEIQAYDEVLFPGISADLGPTRPVVGSITLQLPTERDERVASWVDAGTPPIYFGFGSMPVEDPAKAVEMITEVTAGLGERALICSGVLDVHDAPDAEHTLIVPSVHHASVFPRCRAIVHHGGAGTTAASVRSAVPTVVLWVGADQPVWARQVERLGVGSAHRFSKTTPAVLRDALSTALAPHAQGRAREVAGRMTLPEQSVSTVADLLERAAHAR